MLCGEAKNTDGDSAVWGICVLFLIFLLGIQKLLFGYVIRRNAMLILFVKTVIAVDIAENHIYILSYNPKKCYGILLIFLI